MSRQTTVVGAILLSGAATAGVVAWSALSEPSQPGSSATASSTGGPGAPTDAASTLSVDLAPGTSCLTIPPTGAPCPDQPTVSPNIPANLSCTSQGSADCFAWQDFIALNWPVSTTAGQPDKDASAGDFGEPGDAGAFQPVVWETYKTAGEVFLPDAAPPAPSDAAATPAACSGAVFPAGLPGLLAPAFLAREKLVQSPEFTPSSITQPGGPTAWIADTAGNLVWYQIAVNPAELDYIVDGGLYKAENQWALSVPGKPGVSPPQGSIEIKAAWRQIEDPALYSRYLMASSCIPTKGGGTKVAQLGLVGFHIIHKVKYQPQWVWATFEQVDNAPTRGADAGPPSDAGFSFYNPSCNAAAVPSRCWPSDAGPCAPNTLPSFDLTGYFAGDAGACAPYSTPIVRDTPIPNDPRNGENPVVTINKAVQDTIRAANSNSVFQYYQLVNAMWWDGIQDQMTGGVAAPLSTTTPATLQPSNAAVANTVLETYDQLTIDDGGAPSSCLGCHQYASVPTVDGGDGGRCGAGNCAADFSFVFGKAQVARAPR